MILAENIDFWGFWEMEIIFVCSMEIKNLSLFIVWPGASVYQGILSRHKSVVIKITVRESLACPRTVTHYRRD